MSYLVDKGAIACDNCGLRSVAVSKKELQHNPRLKKWYLGTEVTGDQFELKSGVDLCPVCMSLITLSIQPLTANAGNLR